MTHVGLRAANRGMVSILWGREQSSRQSRDFPRDPSLTSRQFYWRIFISMSFMETNHCELSTAPEYKHYHLPRLCHLQPNKGHSQAPLISPRTALFSSYMNRIYCLPACVFNRTPQLPFISIYFLINKSDSIIITNENAHRGRPQSPHIIQHPRLRLWPEGHFVFISTWLMD